MKSKKIATLLLLAAATAAGSIGLNDTNAFASTPKSTVKATSKSTQTTKQGIVVNVNSTLRVRKSASTSSESLGYLKNGSKVEIVSKSGSWYKIKYNKGYGYVHKDYIKETSTSTNNTNDKNNTSNNVTVVATKQGVVVNIKSTLTVRKSASTDSEALGYLKNGSKVEIVSKSGSWYKIKYNKGYGYVHKDYIKETSTSTNNTNDKNNTSNNVTVVATKQGVVVNIKSTLTVRKSASTDSEALGYLKNGSKVEIVSKSGSWYKIKYNKGYGYVYKDYIKETNTNTNNSTNSNITNNNNNTTNNNTNNSGNNNSNNNNNNNSNTTNDTNNSNNNNNVANNNNSNNPTNKPENVEGTQKYGKVEVNSVLRIREDADTNSKTIGNLENGSVVEIVGEKNNFYNVKYDNIIGYSSKDFIKEISKKEADEIINNNQNGSGITSEITTNYNVSMDSYIKAQKARVPYYSYESYEKYINPNKATNKYQFLRLDEFRNISVDGLNDYFENTDSGVLKGHAKAFVDSAKQFDIDPLYFAAQSIHETGYGKSRLAKGVTITQIANPNKEIYNDKGQLIGYEMIKLKEPVTVYNLFGIGAYDNSDVFPNRALILGTTYAYNHGWTSVDKAVEGAAKFVSDNYVNSSRYNQNTLYKMRFAPNQDLMWHQYATTVWYASEIGEQMDEMKYLYIGNNDFIFDRPKFIESKTLKTTSFITVQEGNENLPQSAAHVSIENQNN